MNLTIVVLSIIILLLLREIYKNWSKIDDSVIRKNRNEMLLLAIQELEKGIISRKEWRLLATFFHPSFKDIWDYTPMEEWKIRIEQERFDSNFWKFYKITPDYSLPSDVVYRLYKEYIFNNIENYPLVKEKYKI